MYRYNDIKTIQFEISSYCNASCPQCPRNYFGGNTIPTLPLRKWTVSDFKSIFTASLLRQLQQVYFCGTYGDPMTNRHVTEMCQFLYQTNPEIEIGLHTNGSVGTQDTYRALAEYTNFIAFGIDGLENTNHIYRRGSKWKKIMENAQAYIENGGYAIWDYIVFEHNQHQVEQARELSKKLGFKEFNVKKTSRFLSRDHVYNKSLAVYNKNGFIDYTISLPTDSRYVNEGYQMLQFVKQDQGLTNYAKNVGITCNADRIKEIYIGADGFVFPCGWLHDRMYGPDVESTADHIKIKNLMSQIGGWTKANVFHTSLSEIVNGDWFGKIEESWNTTGRLERCGMMCGATVNLIGPQNNEVKYKE